MPELAILCDRLSADCSRVVDDCCTRAPGEFRDALHRAVEGASGIVETSLAACASAAWCGADPLAGMPAATATHLIQAACCSLLTLPGFDLDLRTEALWMETGEATAILVADALIPAAMGHLAAKGGIHASELVRSAATALGRRVLQGYSAELRLRTAGRSGWQEREETWRSHAGAMGRFSAGAGALLAGADRTMVEAAAGIGALIGEAAEVSVSGDVPSRGDRSREDPSMEAAGLLERAVALAGGPAAAVLFERLGRSILESLRGADLFEGGTV